MSFKEVVDYLLGELGQPYNYVLKERLVHDIKGYRSLFLRQELERDKNFNINIFKQRFQLEVQNIDSLDNCFKLFDCSIKRTVDLVPKPIRLKTTEPFSYVGTTDTAFANYDISDIQYLEYNKFPSLILPYTYLNNYIYIFKNPKLKYITVEGIFNDPEQVELFCKKSLGEDCSLIDPQTLDIFTSEDLIKRIEDTILNNKLKYLQISNDEEIKLSINE